MTELAPLIATLTAVAPGVATAANDDTIVLGEAPFAGAVESVTYTPDATITGANTNTRAVSLVNKGSDGNGTTVVATLQFNSGVNAADFDETTITLSATAANLNVAAGDILAWASAHVGTGMADPGGLVSVAVSRS